MAGPVSLPRDIAQKYVDGVCPDCGEEASAQLCRIPDCPKRTLEEAIDE